MWHERWPKRWKGEQEIARRFMRDVAADIDDKGCAFISGTFVLELNCGHELDHFQLRIVYPAEFPQRRCHPKVFLDSHHDEWKNNDEAPDSHIESNWRLCLFIPMESGLDFTNGNELENLFPHIHTFLLRQQWYQRDVRQQKALKSKVPEWPGPQRSHGALGMLAAMQESGGSIGRNDPCVCGSGKKYKRCCMAQITLVRDAIRRQASKQK
jgi:hypothetical protein